jgi:hypothetical protein
MCTLVADSAGCRWAINNDCETSPLNTGVLEQLMVANLVKKLRMNLGLSFSHFVFD